MTNLQNAILEACNNDLITTQESTTLFNTIYFESVIDDIGSKLRALSESINNVFKKFVAWMTKNTVENRKKKFLVETSFMTELDNIKRCLDGINNAKDIDTIIDNIEELSIQRKDLAKNKFMIYTDTVKVSSGYKVYTAGELYKLITDIANTVTKTQCKTDIKTAFKILGAKITTYWTLTNAASVIDSVCGNGAAMMNGDADMFRDYMTRNALTLAKMKEHAQRIWDDEYARSYAKYDTAYSYGVIII